MIMTLDQLHTELKRRDIDLQLDGTGLMALDPYHRLSAALDAAIRTYRDQLVSELNAISAAFRPFQTAIDEIYGLPLWGISRIRPVENSAICHVNAAIWVILPPINR